MSPAAGRTTAELIDCVRQIHHKHPIVVWNKRDFLNNWTESDVVVATLAGQVYEFEVKVSRADFQRDKWKLRNQIYSGTKDGRKPNRFWYVTANGVVTMEDIPFFAGWYEWESGQLVLRRRAPLLFKESHGIDVLMRLAMAMKQRLHK